MKPVAMILSFLVGSVSFAESIVGQYYRPYSQTAGTTSFNPETLAEFNADGTYQMSSVHFNALEISVGTYTVSGNQITISPPKYIAECPNVFNDGSGKLTGTFSRTPSALSLTASGESLTINVATPDQVAKIKAYPVCHK